MIPVKLTLKNFIGIKSGMGLDEITIDFSDFGPDDRIIALQGENGKGKSTILDNLTPFRIMPSRASAYSPASFSYYDNTYGDAEKELHWQHGNHDYRSLIKIKGANKTKKTEAYLFRMGAIGWEPAPTGEGDAVSDGKTITYDKAVVNVIGSPEMFFTAAFSSQGKRPIAAYTNGEIKGLMSELLNLDHISELGETAAEVAKGLTARANGFSQALTMLDIDADVLSKMRADLDGVSSLLSLQVQARHQARENVKKAASTLAALQAESGALAHIHERRRSLEEKMHAIDAEYTRRDDDLKMLLTDAERRRSLENDRYYIENKKRCDELKKMHADCEKHADVISRKDEIIEAGAAMKTLNDHKETTQAKIDALNSQATERMRYQNKIDRLKTEREHLNQTAQNIAKQVLSLVEQAALIDEVPCSGTDLQPACKLLNNAILARDTIETRNEEINNLKEQIAELDARISAGNEQMARFNDIDANLATEKKWLEKIKFDLIQNESIAVLFGDLAIAESEYKRMQEWIANYNSDQLDADTRHAAALRDIDDHIEDLAARIGAVELEKAAAVESIQAELAELPEPGDDSAIEKAKINLSTAENIIDGIESDIDEKNHAIAKLKADIRAAEDKATEADSIKARIDRLNAEVVHWRILAKALGKDGIIALSIDDAGPTISSIANDLLLQCYGPRFTVSIDTQAETQSGAMRETFDIVVLDGERDEKKSINKMSGGERVYINECITRAIALYQAQQSGQTYGTLFTDETDGALDPGRKLMFMKMKRKVLEIGNYQREIFISHTPELIDLADAVIDLNIMCDSNNRID